jgi:molecular chaperone GrpE
MTQHEKKTRAEERIAELDVSPSKLLAQIDALTAENEALRAEADALRAEADDHRASHQRALADYRNLQRHTEEEIAKARLAAADRLLLRFVDLADDFDRSIEHVPAALAGDGWVEGIAAIDRKLRNALESQGVTPIDAMGKPFDPALHEAIASIPGTGRPEGEVVAEMRRGYLVGDRVLRPSMVGVADGSEAAADA